MTESVTPTTVAVLMDGMAMLEQRASRDRQAIRVLTALMVVSGDRDQKASKVMSDLLDPPE